jgi:hypothetical protein
MLNTFQRLIRTSLNIMLKEKVIIMKVVGNFKPYDLESKLVQNGDRMLQKSPNYGRIQNQFRDSKN